MGCGIIPLKVRNDGLIKTELQVSCCQLIQTCFWNLALEAKSWTLVWRVLWGTAGRGYSYGSIDSASQWMTPTQPDISVLDPQMPFDYYFQPYANMLTYPPADEESHTEDLISRLPDQKAIRAVLCKHVSEDDMAPMMDQLTNHFTINNVDVSEFAVTGLRAGRVKVPGTDEKWPIVEWREREDTDVMAIFKIHKQNSQCSWLTHRGEGRWHREGRWRQSSLTWYLSDIPDLCDLLTVAQQDLGIRQWCQIEKELSVPSGEPSSDDEYSFCTNLAKERD